MAGVGADDDALATLHSPELDQAHLKDERRRGVSLFSYPYLAIQLIDDVARVSSSRRVCDSSVRARPPLALQAQVKSPTNQDRFYASAFVEFRWDKIVAIT